MSNEQEFILLGYNILEYCFLREIEVCQKKNKNENEIASVKQGC